jgi:hypothetical protein
MNKKVLIRLGIFALALLVLILLFTPPRDSVEHGNRYVVTTTKVEKADKAEVKEVFLLVDPSGSMKGYLDFGGYPDARKTMVNTITKPLDRLSSDYGASLKVKYGTSGNYTVTSTTDVQNRMTTGSAFNGAITMLDKMIADAVKQATDSTVSMLVSDMVLSYGRSVLISKNDPWLNKHNLGDLGSSIHTALKSAGDIKVLMLQYYSDFNGRYYYNCTENIENGNQYRNELMRDRPYYIMVFGKKEILESLLDNGTFVKFENIYASFDLDEKNMVESPLTVKFSPESTWISDNSSEDSSSEKTGTIWTSSDLDGSRETFEVQFKKFDIPAFLNQKYEIGDYHLSDVIEDIEEVTDPGNPNLLRFRITMKPFNVLPQTGTVAFTLICRNTWTKEASVKDDDDVNIDSVSDLEKKTWGLSTIIENIDDAYFGGSKRVPQTVASVDFKMAKN